MIEWKKELLEILWGFAGAVFMAWFFLWRIELA